MNNYTIWYKMQRVLRTVVQVIIAFVAVWGSIAAIAPQILDELAKILPGSWIAWLVGFIAVVTAIAGALSRIMAFPVVNEWLTRIGLGSAPKSAGKQGIPDEVTKAVVEGVTRREFRGV